MKQLAAEKEKNLKLSASSSSSGGDPLLRYLPILPKKPIPPTAPESGVDQLLAKALKEQERARRHRTVERGTQARHRDTQLREDGSNR